MDWITNAALHLKPGLGITSISTLYKTTMTQAYTRIRILGDETVNSALQSKLDREKNWLRKKNSITDYAEKMFQQATLENYGQAEMPEWDDQASKHQCDKKWKQLSVNKDILKMKLSGEHIQKHS